MSNILPHVSKTYKVQSTLLYLGRSRYYFTGFIDDYDISAPDICLVYCVLLLDSVQAILSPHLLDIYNNSLMLLVLLC